MKDDARPDHDRPRKEAPKRLQSLALPDLDGLEAGAVCDIDDPDCDPATGRPRQPVAPPPEPPR